MERGVLRVWNEGKGEVLRVWNEGKREEKETRRKKGNLIVEELKRERGRGECED